MLSNESRRLLSCQLRAFGEQVRRLGIDLRAEARRLFDRLKLDGAIKALTPLERCQVDILEAAGQRDPAYGQRYAVDGGSTHALRLENGTTLCAMQAVCSAEPDRRFQGLPLEAYRTVVLVSHSERLDLGLSHVDHLEEGFIHLWRVHLSRTYLREGIERVIKGLARAACEGQHVQWMLQQLQPSEGLFLLDGNLYPIGLYYALSGQQDDRLSRDSRPNWTDWHPAQAIMAQPLRVVEAFAERGLACIGLNKNPGTSWLLDFCLEEAERNWSGDAQFIKAVLSSRSRRSLGYTNWFVQERYPLPRSGGRELESFDLFERLSGLGLKLAPRAYHLCFFYVYDPRIKSVLKVEAPRVVLEAHDLQRLRRAIIAEIARGKGVPGALRRADSRARITTEEAVGLLRACGIAPDYTFNQSRGAPL
ncbi:MAG TPA: DNA double-strand break repair nuclease NurA [Candidatus Fraserbacteria bacterium]|nr:DNA double-strand break repair nuclease NurA [Candidatus Fraserbacteria bacterium]